MTARLSGFRTFGFGFENSLGRAIGEWPVRDLPRATY
jgi:hypothetical protein